MQIIPLFKKKDSSIFAPDHVYLDGFYQNIEDAIIIDLEDQKGRFTGIRQAIYYALFMNYEYAKPVVYLQSISSLSEIYSHEKHRDDFEFFMSLSNTRFREIPHYEAFFRADFYDINEKAKFLAFELYDKIRPKIIAYTDYLDSSTEKILEIFRSESLLIGIVSLLHLTLSKEIKNFMQ